METETKPKRAPKAIPGLHIVWRMKGNHGWQKGYIRDALAKGKIIHIVEGQYSGPSGGDIVAVDDIDWLRQ